MYSKREQIMKTKDISIYYLYEKHESSYSKHLDNIYKDKHNYYGIYYLVIELKKNKKIDPSIIYDIYKNRNNLDNKLYRGNIFSKYGSNNRKCKYIDYITDFGGIILELYGSRNGLYDYSLDNLPLDLPITQLYIRFNNYKYNFTNFPDSITSIVFSNLEFSNIVYYLPKSLNYIKCMCNINLSNLPLIHKHQILLDIQSKEFDSINYLPNNYINSIYTYQIKPDIVNLPITLELLRIGFYQTKLLDLPRSLQKLVISDKHMQFNDIKEILIQESRSHILHKF